LNSGDRRTEHLGDHDDGQRVGDRGHEVEWPAGAERFSQQLRGHLGDARLQTGDGTWRERPGDEFSDAVMVGGVGTDDVLLGEVMPQPGKLLTLRGAKAREEGLLAALVGQALVVAQGC
jgi:hypothetical protein